MLLCRNTNIFALLFHINRLVYPDGQITTVKIKSFLYAFLPHLLVQSLREIKHKYTEICCYIVLQLWFYPLLAVTHTYYFFHILRSSRYTTRTGAKKKIFVAYFREITIKFLSSRLTNIAWNSMVIRTCLLLN